MPHFFYNIWHDLLFFQNLCKFKHVWLPQTLTKRLPHFKHHSGSGFASRMRRPPSSSFGEGKMQQRKARITHRTRACSSSSCRIANIFAVMICQNTACMTESYSGQSFMSGTHTRPRHSFRNKKFSAILAFLVLIRQRKWRKIQGKCLI